MKKKESVNAKKDIKENIAMKKFVKRIVLIMEFATKENAFVNNVFSEKIAN